MHTILLCAGGAEPGSYAQLLAQDKSLLQEKSSEGGRAGEGERDFAGDLAGGEANGCTSLQVLLRLYEGSIKALLRRFGLNRAMKALLRRYIVV